MTQSYRGVYNRNARNPHLKPNWWIRYWVKGEEIREPGRGGQKATALHYAEIKRQLKAATWVHPNARAKSRTVFKNYAPTVIAKRIQRKVAGASKDERGHVENHLIPVFGELEVREMTFRVIRDGFAEHINTKNLAGRTITNIHCTLRAILIEAVEDGILDNPPIPLTVERDHLPPRIDKDPDWRADARFDGDEIVKLLAVESILSLRRVMYVTWFLTGSRFSEILELRVKHYNREKRPLRSLSVHAAKVGRHKGVGRRRREVPVHPDLQRWLDWWLREEYEVLYGRRPGPDDLLFPTLSARRIKRGEKTCSHGEIYKQWQRHDLKVAGLRHRKLHDARRTLLSALKNAGVDNDIRRKITHYSVEDRVLDGYTIVEWKTLCEAMIQVDWQLPAPCAATAKRGGKVVKIR
jgi:integrase